ncbi:MAG: hypothetical protein ACK4RK_03675 [Gemmataceae bacterium]
MTPAEDHYQAHMGRVPLGYFKQPTRLGRWKLWVSIAALLLAIGWPVTALLREDGGRLDYAPGPVAAVHAMWETNCEACHQPFRPIKDRPWTHWFLTPTPGINQKCTTCHSGPLHHAHQVPDLSCASCHHDHQGRHFSLTRMSDRHCTQCHANLIAHMTEKSRLEPLIDDKVTVFGEGTHPKFRSIAADDGQLIFSHARHLMPGMVLAKDGKNPFTFADILDPNERERYQREQQQRLRLPDLPQRTEVVRLDCGSCHQLDSGDFGIQPFPADLPARSDGHYMLPITYENQCRACHPLTVNVAPSKPELARDITIPHGLQPAAVRDFLWGAVATQLTSAKHPEPSETRAPRPRPLPGKDGTEAEARLRAEIERQLAGSEKILYREPTEQVERQALQHRTTCLLCHPVDQSAKGTVPQTIQPPRIPQVWYQHAKFNHVAHRAMDCRSCHYKQESNTETRIPVAASTNSRDVLIPNLDNCVQCHAPAHQVNGVPRGGARFDCTACHDYHHRDKPAYLLQGIGADARNPHPLLDLTDYFLGTKGGKK